MKEKVRICRICKNEFITTAPRTWTCSHECRSIYNAEKYRRIKERQKRPKTQSDNMKEYYAYCEKNGFITYGKFQAMKTAQALKEQRG